MTLNEFLLEYGRHPLGGGFTSGFREHLEAAVAERVEAAVARERAAIVKYLIAQGEWDSTTGECLYCNGKGFVDYDSQGIDQLCYECHVDLGELITEIEKGEHLK